MISMPSQGVVAAALGELLSRWPDAALLGLRCGAWSGPAELAVAGRACHLRWCPSSLAARAAVQEALAHGVKDPPVAMVLITDRTDDEIGLDLLAHLPRHRFVDLDLWRALPHMFSVNRIDSRLIEQRWLAEALVASQPAAGYASAEGSNVLDLDTAWSAFFEHALGLFGGGADLDALISWSARPEARDAWARLGEEARIQTAERVRGRIGPCGEAVVRLLDQLRADEIVATGLVSRVLFSPACVGTAAGLKAEGRFEALVGVTLEPASALVWADASERFVGSLPGAEHRAHLQRAEELLDQLTIVSFAGASQVLPSGLSKRVDTLITAISAQFQKGSRKSAVSPEACLADVKQHHHASPDLVNRLSMALRLARWLDSKPTADMASLPEAATHYAHELSLVDLARNVLFTHDVALTGEVGAQLSSLFRDLLARAQEIRQGFNERFGALIAGWFEAESKSEVLLPVDAVIDRVVAPLAAAHPVLMLVLDGLSFAVFQELIADLLDHGLEPMVPEALAVSCRGNALVGLATLPSVTHASRHALLTGRLETGGQTSERRGFAAHPAWRGMRTQPPILFHKGDLGAPDGGLAAPVLAAIGNDKTKVVAAVINAIDDHLSRGDQVLAPWRVTTIRHFEAMLQAARSSNRVVVVASDHGHLPEWNLDYRDTTSDGARHRPDSSAPGSGEIKVVGQRVLTERNAIVVPWSETVRYGRKQAGYHGGASPQELLVPIAVLAPDVATIAGWRRLPGNLPSWWEASPGDPSLERLSRAQLVSAPEWTAGVKSRSSVKSRGSAGTSKRPPKPDSQPEQRRLFKPLGEGPDTTVPPGPDPTGNSLSLLDQLFASDVYAEQVARAGGPAFADPTRIRPLLALLVEHGGRSSIDTVMRTLNLGLPRLRGIITNVQRLINVDGYPILDLDESGQSVHLDTALLCTQFDLKSSAVVTHGAPRQIS